MKEQPLYEIGVFCNILNVFMVTFEQFNASLMNTSIILFRNKILLTPNV